MLWLNEGIMKTGSIMRRQVDGKKHDNSPGKRVRREVDTSLKPGAKMGWKIKIDFENCDCQLRLSTSYSQVQVSRQSTIWLKISYFR